MNNTKHTLKTFLALLILSISIFAGCEKEEVPQEEQVVLNGSSESGSLDEETKQFPDAINYYIEQAYPQAVIISVELEDNEEYEVELSNGTKLIFNLEGQFIEEDLEEEQAAEENEEQLSFSQLPLPIQQYLNTHYPNQEIEEVELENDNIYEVELGNGTELYFDVNGNLLYIEIDGEYEGDDDDDAISLVQLPASIKQYITINYPNHLIVQADYIDEEASYKVRISEDIELYFDQEGNLLNVETEFRLTLDHFEFPDTVQVGTTVELKGFLVNRNINTFEGDLNINYGIEDEPIANPTSTSVDGEEQRIAVTIAPKDSISVTIPVLIDNNKFNVASFDIVIVWPEVTTANAINPFIPGNTHEVLQTYVKP